MKKDDALRREIKALQARIAKMSEVSRITLWADWCRLDYCRRGVRPAYNTDYARMATME